MAVIARKFLLFMKWRSFHLVLACRNAFIIWVLILVGFTVCKAQFIDSIYSVMKTKPKIIFRFDSRNSFIDNSRAKIFGWKVGVEFDKRIRIGGGFSNLVDRHDPSLDKVIYESNGLDTFRIATLRFSYISYFIDYIFLNTRRWEFSVPIQLGFGGSRYKYRDENAKLQIHNAKSVLLFEPALSVQYKITKWIGLGTGAGYRLMLLNNKAIEKKFNSPIYIFKFKIFFGGVFQSFSKKDKKSKK